MTEIASSLSPPALQVNLARLRDRAVMVGVLALLATVISTIVVGAGFFALGTLIGLPITASWAVVFGAIISPTDPIAVLSMLRNVKVPAAIQVEMQGEALFNDGIGIVLFTVLLRFASGYGEVGPSNVFMLLALEAGGGIGLCS